MKSLRLRSFAKVNLGLEVLGVREDWTTKSFAGESSRRTN